MSDHDVIKLQRVQSKIQQKRNAHLLSGDETAHSDAFRILWRKTGSKEVFFLKWAINLWRSF
jgi:hypothetical protein